MNNKDSSSVVPNNSTKSQERHPETDKIPAFWVNYDGKNIPPPNETGSLSFHRVSFSQLRWISIHIDREGNVVTGKKPAPKLTRMQRRRIHTAEKKAWHRTNRMWRILDELSLEEEGVLSEERTEALKQELLDIPESRTLSRNTVLQYLMVCIRRIAEDMCTDPLLRKQCFENPETDFTRTQKISLASLLVFLLTMAGDFLNREVYEYFKYTPSLPSSSAMVQRRAQLRPEGMEYFFHRMTEICQELSSQVSQPLYGFLHILAVDGSDINVFYDPKAETYIPAKEGQKGWNQYHLNGLYDAVTRVFVHAVLQPDSKMNETRATVAMIAAMDFIERTLITADRGYGSLNLIETIRRKKNLECLIRVKENWLKELENLGLAECDVDMTVHVITTQRNIDKERVGRGEAKYLSGESKFGKYKVSKTWDYESEVDVKFRVVRFLLSSGQWETLVTTLSREEYPVKVLEQLYHLRWNLEGAYRVLKWDNHLAQMHCKIDRSSQQEIFARLTMFNIVTCILNVVSAMESDQKEQRTEGSGEPAGPHKYEMKLSRRFATHVICDYMKHPESINFEVFDEIRRHKVPVRPGRSFKRDMRAIGFARFLYR